MKNKVRFGHLGEVSLAGTAELRRAQVSERDLAHHPSGQTSSNGKVSDSSTMDIVGAGLQLAASCFQAANRMTQVKADRKFIAVIRKESTMLLAQIEATMLHLSPDERPLAQELEDRLNEIIADIDNLKARSIFTKVCTVLAISGPQFKKRLSRILSNFHFQISLSAYRIIVAGQHDLQIIKENTGEERMRETIKSAMELCSAELKTEFLKGRGEVMEAIKKLEDEQSHVIRDVNEVLGGNSAAHARPDPPSNKCPSRDVVEWEVTEEESSWFLILNKQFNKISVASLHDQERISEGGTPSCISIRQ
jgi:hypothetical protein